MVAYRLKLLISLKPLGVLMDLTCRPVGAVHIYSVQQTIRKDQICRQFTIECFFFTGASVPPLGGDKDHLVVGVCLG